MKTLKTTIATIAMSLLATSAFAQSPKAQRGLENAELHKRIQDKKGRAEKQKKEKAHADAGVADTNKSGAKDRAETAHEEKHKHGNRAVPTAQKSAKGLDGLQKEQRKHLLRRAKIARISDIAKQNGNARLLTKAGELRAKENLRFQRALQRIRSADAPDVGSPNEN